MVRSPRVLNAVADLNPETLAIMLSIDRLGRAHLNHAEQPVEGPILTDRIIDLLIGGAYSVGTIIASQRRHESACLREGSLVCPWRNAHGPPKAAGKMGLIRESGCNCHIAERMTDLDQAGGETDASLPLIAMWRHAGFTLEPTK